MSTPVQAPTPVGGFPVLSNSSPSARCLHTGYNGGTNAADGTDYTGVATENIVAEMLVPISVMVSGFTVKCGSSGTFSDNVKFGLYDANGVLLATSAATAGGSAAGDSYFSLPIAFEFSSGAAVAATQIFIKAGTYYLAVHLNGTTAHLNTFVNGRFGAGKITVVDATTMVTTDLTITPPVTFTTALGPIGGLY